ncbi:MAG: 3-isopropylmalate dehydrogenase [Gemmatimonadetes bacterium]|nr:3-isopropylmalate dehydrogenase [Gemmatimonadota bacterium]
MSRPLIAVLSGDGIGPEVTAAARLVLETVAETFGHHFAFEGAAVGGAAVDLQGSSLPAATLALCRRADAILFGAVGGPKWEGRVREQRPEYGLLELRRSLGLYANIRPVTPFRALHWSSPLRAEALSGVDFVVVRELTGGIYFGEKVLEPITGGERATDVCSYSTEEIARIVRVAARLAQSRRRRLTSVDKANVLETSRLWRRVTARVVAEEFPEVQLDHLLVDACAMHMIQRPASFDVIVTENMFGDILTDEAAVLAGSIGLLPSASLGEGSVGLYEPIHGSAPDLVGTGGANPLGAILSAGLLLRHSLRLEREAQAVEHAVRGTVEAGILTRDVAPQGTVAHSTREVAERVAGYVSEARRVRTPSLKA